MGQEKNPINKQSDSWKLFERIGVIIALIASLATVVGLLLQVRSEKRGSKFKLSPPTNLLDCHPSIWIFFTI